jgi:2-polyprenyl-3-methyl-5-hydroxy-6-metoxy-1,4-benzoquinol methylase
MDRSKNNLVKIHDEHAESINYRERFGKFPFSVYADLFIEAVMKFLRPKIQEKILDIGCGDGIYIDELISRGAVVYGIDIAEKKTVQM